MRNDTKHNMAVKGNISKQDLFHNPVLKGMIRIATIAVIYFIVGNLSLKLIFEPEGIGAVWPNSGIFLSAILLTRRKLLPFLIGTLFITDLIIELIAGSPFDVSLVYAFALTFDASLSAWLITRFVGIPFTFYKVKHVFGFIALSVIFSNALATTIASLAPYLFLGESFWNSWMLWWSSDAVGNLLITPLVLSWASIVRTKPLDIKRVAEALVLFLSIIVVDSIALQSLGSNINLFSILNYLTFPFLIWAAIRFGVRGVTTASVVLTAIILYFTLSGQIMFFNSGSPLHAVILVQLYIAIISISSLILASVYSERKQVEEALLEKEHILSESQQIAHIGSWVVDMTDRISWSDETYRIYGVSPDTFTPNIGSFLNLIHPDDRAAMQAWINAFRAGEKPDEIEFRSIMPDGTFRFIRGRSEMKYDAKNRRSYLSGTAQDITERKLIEEEIRRGKERLALAQEVGKIGTFEWLIQENKTIWTEQMEALYGLHPGDFGGNNEHWEKMLHPQDHDRVMAEAARAMSEKKDLEIEYRVVLHDGSVHWILDKARTIYSESDKPLRMVGVNMDITERKQMEEALHKAHNDLEIRIKERTAELEEANKALKAEITERELTEEALHRSEERYRTMIEHSNDMIWTLDTQGNFMYFNKRAEDITGYKLAEWQGKSFVPMLSPEDFPKLEKIFFETLSGKTQNYDVNVYKKDGSFCILSVNTAPLVESGEIVGTISFGRDITERKKAEETRVENERLLLANKTKSVFIATMNHELRTPLTSIIGFSELLKDKTIVGELNEKQEHFVNKVISNSNHLLELINDFLDLSKIESGKTELVFEEFSVPAAIDEVVTLIEEITTKRNIIIRNELEPLDIKADKRRFKQIILNLLNNAVKFSKSGGGIVTIAAKKSGEMAQISVSDTGIGIKKEDLERLFWAFEQLDSGNSRKYSGTGLGLTISKWLVELHGGTIKVESKYGEGSTFTFSLPMKQDLSGKAL